jgi:hypothetical protein
MDPSLDILDRPLEVIGKIVFSLVLPTSLLAISYGVERGLRKQRMTLAGRNIDG